MMVMEMEMELLKGLLLLSRLTTFPSLSFPPIVKSIQDAIRDKKQRLTFMGEEVSLCPSVGIFITMNPGYASRTELPENLKALFR
ncbi:hypothetical protein NQZ68_033679 [Dissostichus eleginoides]|nr:hypothetical protein NQZ68_033679 [Dissostichus eleginoides]